MLEELPERVRELLQSSAVANYASVSAAGMPVDTPVLLFPSKGLASFDLATGLSYPSKAERARRNPKVGLLIAGGPDEPVVSIAGMAAVRDADLQGNVLRYLAEVSYTLPNNPDWALARQAVWYWTRVIVEIAPAKVLWWDSPSEMDSPPHVWRTAGDALFPQSDPAPPGKTSSPAKWAEKPWPELAEQALARGVPGHLTLIDSEGFPLPVRVRGIAQTAGGFALDLPRGLPWPIDGKACLTFGGIETFLGEVTGADGAAAMRVERTLGVFPMSQDLAQLWQPAPGTRTQLMRRLEEELKRRGQSIPAIPKDRPPPSAGYRRRMARMGVAAPAS